MKSHPAPAPTNVSAADQQGHTLAYSFRSIAFDYARAAIGLGLSLCLLVITDGTVVHLVLLTTAAGCLWFLARTRLRQRTRVGVEAWGVLVTPTGARVPWQDLSHLRLRWFGSPRTGQGWLELELKAPGATVRIDSELEGFDHLLDVAAEAARRNELELDPATAVNLAAAEAKPIRTRGGSSAPRG
ncbi:MAG: hypothetical protein U1E45_06525 [Geminicoccaceae bacterium]